MTDQPTPRGFELSDREHRWLTALLIMATLGAAFLVIDYVGKYLTYFGDVIMIFFLAWLLAFILSPIANGLVHLFPRLPRWLAVIVVYSLLIVVLIAAILLVAQQLYSSINNLVTNWPSGEALRQKLQPGQDWLNSVGGSQISLYDQVNQLLDNLKNGATNLAKPLGDIAVASIGIFGNLLFIFFLSLYMAVDRDRIVSFLFRIVPPTYTDEARLLEHSVSRSFGGFLRGQALMGLIYAAISMIASLLLGLPYMPVTAASSGILQAIPFFGPFISWTPPVLVAIFFKPDAAVLAFLIMLVGWFVLMNIIQPRVMAEAVGLHPVVVLGSVMIGSKLAGIPGAIFGIPVAAVIASFFFFYLSHRALDADSVAVRAARRVEEREGRPVRVPRLPQAGEDQELEQDPEQVAPAPTVKRRSRTAREAADDTVTTAIPAEIHAVPLDEPAAGEGSSPPAPSRKDTPSKRGEAKNPA